MTKLICPSCSRESFTASPQIKSKCSYCDFIYSIADVKHNKPKQAAMNRWTKAITRSQGRRI